MSHDLWRDIPQGGRLGGTLPSFHEVTTVLQRFRSGAAAAVLLATTLVLATSPGARAGAAESAGAGHPTGSWMSARARQEAKTHGLIYVSYISAIEIYSKTGGSQPIGQITNGVGFAGNIWADAAGGIYAADEYCWCGYASVIQQYAPGATSPAFTYYDGLLSPGAVAVGPDGTIYAADFGGENIVAYAPGQQRYLRMFYPTHGSPQGITIGPKGEVVVVYRDPLQWTSFGVAEFAPGSSVSQKLPAIVTSPQGGIAFDPSGNLLVTNSGTGIDIFKPGASKPFRTFTGFSDAYTFAFDPDGRHLYVADLGNRVVDVLAYPAGNIVRRIGGFAANTFGVAATGPQRS